MPMVDNETNVGSARFEAHQRFTMSDDIFLRPADNSAVYAQDQELESSYLQVTCDTASKNLYLPMAADMGGLVLDIRNKGGETITLYHTTAYSADGSTAATGTTLSKTIAPGYRGRMACDGTAWYELSNAVS